MAITAGSGFGSVSNALSVEAMIVISMHLRVKQGAAEVRKRLAGAVTALALQRWFAVLRRGRLVCGSS